MFGVKITFITLLTLALFCYVRLWIWQAIPREQVAPPKYVGFSLNWGRMGNQLFHLVTGYGIARTLGRVHYLPKSGPLDHVKRFLKVFDKVFPALRQSYVLMPNGSVEVRVPFVGSCCGYEDPRRYLNHSATYLHLNFIYGQNPRFFEPYLDDVRRLLKFSEIFAKEGDYQIKALEAPLNSMMCIHIRRGDFVNIKVETNVSETIRAVNNISDKMGTSRFMIFGDDQGFMRNLSHLIASSRNISENAVLISNFSDTMDLYLSSRLCNSFLITAVTSTFGWWLAFFIENQNAVYYLLDNRRQADKVPSKELFFSFLIKCLMKMSGVRRWQPFSTVSKALRFCSQSVVKFRVVSVTLLTFGLFCYVRLWTWNSIPHDQVAPQKYVGFSLSWGRMGNQLFHLITGYGIARSLGRVHYIPYSTLLAHVNRYLIEFDRIFPELRKSYIIMPKGSVETKVPFVRSCCAYDNPKRYLNHSATYLHLKFAYGQNPRFFEDYLDDVRQLLRFSPAITKEGDYQLKALDV